MCQEFLNLAHLHFHLFFKLNQKTFPSVNSREVSVQIPVKFGYDFTLGEKLHFIPSVGAYGRFSMVSIKENVTENTGENSGNCFKWNSFNNYQHNTNRLDGYKRWDVGGLIEGKFVYANRYAVTLDYSRGFLDKSPQFKLEPQLSSDIGIYIIVVLLDFTTTMKTLCGNSCKE